MLGSCMTRSTFPPASTPSKTCTMLRAPVPQFYLVVDTTDAMLRNQCSIFRPWQGRTALSHTVPGEGTLRVLPMLSLATAYIILRPFFRLRPEHASKASTPAEIPLHADAWVLDLENTEFPGSTPGKTQAITPATHPHLRIDKTVVSIPQVSPGDQVYCERHSGGSVGLGLSHGFLQGTPTSCTRSRRTIRGRAIRP